VQFLRQRHGVALEEVDRDAAPLRHDTSLVRRRGRQIAPVT
jgi:hypothetical protein